MARRASPRQSLAQEPGQRRRRPRLDAGTLQIEPTRAVVDGQVIESDGKPPHPDTITRRFKKLSRAADLPAIDLHDVRHSYATAGRNAKIDWKALSKRIGHADVAFTMKFTMKQYVQTDLEADREVANTLADLIIGGMLVSGIEDQADDDTRSARHEANSLKRTAPVHKSVHNHKPEAGPLFENRPLALW